MALVQNEKLFVSSTRDVVSDKSVTTGRCGMRGWLTVRAAAPPPPPEASESQGYAVPVGHGQTEPPTRNKQCQAPAASTLQSPRSALQTVIWCGSWREGEVNKLPRGGVDGGKVEE